MTDPWEAQREALGAFIREQRKRANLSLRQLAELTSLSNPYLSQVERGLHQPSVRVLKALSGALNVSAETLLAQAGLIDAMTAGANGPRAPKSRTSRAPSRPPPPPRAPRRTTSRPPGPRSASGTRSRSRPGRSAAAPPACPLPPNVPPPPPSARSAPPRNDPEAPAPPRRWPVRSPAARSSAAPVTPGSPRPRPWPDR